MNDDFLDLYNFRIIVCGDRDWTDEEAIWSVLDRLVGQYGEHFFLLAQGDARGADLASKMWAEDRQIDHISFPARWKLLKNSAGPTRNRRQLFIKPHLVVAFHDDMIHSKGTKDMVSIAKEAGVQTKVYKHKEK